MKVTQVMLSAGFGGAERYFVDLCQALLRRGHEVQAVCHRDFVGRESLEKINNLQIAHFAVMGWWDLYHQARMRTAIDHFRADIVHAHLARGAYIAGKVCHSLEAPLVVKTHNYVNMKYYRNVDHFIATTTDQKNYLMRHRIAEMNISVIPNFSSATVVTAKGRQDGILHFAAYGRLVNKKGMHVLLNSFRQFLNAGSKAVLHIGGDGPERNQLQKRAKELGLDKSVIFHGWIKDTDSFIGDSDIMVLPSLEEPFGIVVLEIMAKGKPLIATRTDGPMSILDESSAWLVEPDDEKALSQAMLKAAGNPEQCNRFAGKAQNLFVERYSEEKVVPVIIDTYQQVIDRFKAVRPDAGGL